MIKRELAGKKGCGPLLVLYQLAANQTDAASPRFVLQGRDERTGQWLPGQRMIKLGTTEMKLLAW